MAHAHGQDAIPYAAVYAWNFVAVVAVLFALAVWGYWRVAGRVRGWVATIAFMLNAPAAGLAPLAIAFATDIPERVLLLECCLLGAANLVAARDMLRLSRRPS